MKPSSPTPNWRAFLCCGIGLSVIGSAAQADEDAAPPWQLRVSANALFNVSASFKGHPSPQLLTSGHERPGAQNYDNGYAGRDVSSDPNLSTYWGYNQASQQILSGGNVTGLNYERTSFSADQSSRRSDVDPGPGGDIILRRQIGKWSKARFGLDLGFSYNKANAEDDSSYWAAGQRTTYAHGLLAPINAGLFPSAGYQGPHYGLGPILNPTPTVGQTTTVPGAVLVSGSRQVDADLFGVRLGPCLELPISKELLIAISAGGAIALVRDTVSWTERVAVNTATDIGYWTGQSSAAGDSFGVTAGFYAGADVSYLFSKSWALFGGVRFQDAGTYTHQIGQGQMELDLRQTFSVSLGVGYSF
jgi:hypothetical protein